MESQEIYNQVEDDSGKICTTSLRIIHWKLKLFEVGGFVEQLFFLTIVCFCTSVSHKNQNFLPSCYILLKLKITPLEFYTFVSCSPSTVQGDVPPKRSFHRKWVSVSRQAFLVQ